MIEPEEIEKWAELYDFGYRNLDLSSAARRELYRLVRERYAILFPGRSVPFAEFNAKTIRKIKACLKHR